MRMDGYGGRAGSFQFDERVVDGIRTEDVWKRIEARKAADDSAELRKMG